MQLGVRDVAKALDVSEKTIYRWLRDGRLPAHRVNDQYRFNRSELLEWATAEGVAVDPALFAGEADEPPLPTLAEAIAGGGVNHDVPGVDKAAVLASVIGLMPLPAEVDRKFLLDVILARESLGSTGIGEGLALPHVRNPIVLHIQSPMIAVSFLRKPVDFGAIDGKPVHTLFTLISPAIKQHLHLLSRLTFALRDEGFRDRVARRAAAADILAAARECDNLCARPAAPPDQSQSSGD